MSTRHRRPLLPISLGLVLISAGALGATFLSACSEPARAQHQKADADNAAQKSFEVVKSKAEWRKQLTDQQFHVLREAGTERAFSGEYWNHKGEGHYVCAGCGQPLYASKDKFKSGTGWPSYTRPVDPAAIVVKKDVSFGMVREELICSRCGGHLGHVFNDGPPPTGERHCINSASLVFESKNKAKAGKAKATAKKGE